jgi:hypothetical protein
MGLPRGSDHTHDVGRVSTVSPPLHTKGVCGPDEFPTRLDVASVRPNGLADKENARRTSHYGARSERWSVILTYHSAKRTTNMTRFATTVLAAVMLMQPALSVAGYAPTDSRAKPNSFVPHPHSNTHVYGAPIRPAIVGHARTSQHRATPKKRSQSAANRDSR